MTDDHRLRWPFDLAAFDAACDEIDLTDAERMGYIRLLDALYQAGGNLPEYGFQNRAKMAVRSGRRLVAKLRAKLDCGFGTVSHKRVDRELDAIRRNSAAGKVGADARWGKSSDAIASKKACDRIEKDGRKCSKKTCDRIENRMPRARGTLRGGEIATLPTYSDKVLNTKLSTKPVRDNRPIDQADLDRTTPAKRTLGDVAKHLGKSMRMKKTDFSKSANRRAYAHEKMVQQLVSSHGVIEEAWTMIEVAEDPKHAAHEMAVELVRKAAKLANVKWTPPRRSRQ